VVLGGATAVGVLAATELTGHPLTQAGPIVRNVVGLTGLVALGCAVFGASRGWLLPLTWTVFVVRYAPPFGVPPTRPTYKVMLTWLMQPGGSRPALVAAIVLGVLGALAHAVAGARR
jgi:hypothetical protein